MPLKTYRQKRNFSKTSEPKGKASSATSRIYVIHKHAASHLHYDFRLALNGVLISFAVPKGPSLDPRVKRLAMHVEDHPLEYAGFEGIIPKGQYGGGTVMLWDKGTWISKDENPTKAYKEGKLTFELKAQKLKGVWTLLRMGKNDKTWLLIKGKDKYARSSSEYDVLKAKPNSALSKKTMDEIADEAENVWNVLDPPKNKKRVLKKKQREQLTFNLDLPHLSMPKIIYPQLATLVDEPPAGDEWVHEIKFDGYRLLALKQGDNLRLMTRRGNDWTNKFKNLLPAIKSIPYDFIFDGEVVVLDNKQRSNFQLLQNAIKAGTEHFYYFIFDLLYFDKYRLTNQPLLKRKAILEKILHQYPHVQLKYSDHVRGSGKAILKQTCNLGLEGIVSKLSDSVYVEKRSKTWLKIKCILRQEFVIAGFTKPQGSRQRFGSLLLGTYNNKKRLVYNGNVGTGFTGESLESIYKNLKKYITQRMPFDEKPPASKDVTWVKPVLVAEIAFAEWTNDNIVRQASFKGLRLDKSAKAIIKEVPLSIRKLVKK